MSRRRYWWNRGKQQKEAPPEKKKDVVKVVANPAAKPAPKSVSPAIKRLPYSKRDKNEVKLNLTAEAFAKLQSWCWQYSPKECAGFGMVTKEDGGNDSIILTLDWVWVDTKAKMSAGGVETSTHELAMHCMENDIDIRKVNLQWHTHPTFSAYWSGTDTTDQVDLLEEIAIGRKNDEFVFIVFNRMNDFVVRRVVLKDGEVDYYQDGTAWVNGVRIGKEEYSGYSGYAGYGYSGGYYGSQYKGADTYKDWTYKNGVWQRNGDKSKDNSKVDSAWSWVKQAGWIQDPKTNKYYHPDSKTGKQLAREVAKQEEEQVQEKPPLAFGTGMVNGEFYIAPQDYDFAVNHFPRNYRAVTPDEAKKSDNRETSGARASYMGFWSNYYTDYDYLFNVLNVPKYNFMHLARRVDQEMRRPFYYQLLDRPWCWARFVTDVLYKQAVTDDDRDRFYNWVMSKPNNKLMNAYFEDMEVSDDKKL